MLQPEPASSFAVASARLFTYLTDRQTDRQKEEERERERKREREREIVVSLPTEI